ncbi:19724_t:CDS:2 [Cetraspora pellucida]|uniref:19724_t:CDS:1 n=1 Tax=Cetraspora pellucida TaxID=1433469 RepID=A0A9N9IZF1_9GLOM|nr:19724_t:CDS:2 [Cetraspora pellucida]
MVDDNFEIEPEEGFLTPTTDDHVTRNGWYEEEEVEAFLAIPWNKMELKELRDEESTPNPILANEKLDPYDDKKYVGEPYEKEVRYKVILESIALETHNVDGTSTKDKKDENSCSMTEDEIALEDEHKRHAIEHIRDKRHRDSSGNCHKSAIQIVDNRKENNSTPNEVKNHKAIEKEDTAS